MPDQVPLVDVQDDVDALSTQPLTLVEAVLRSARGTDDRERADHGALRRSAAERQLELDPLVDGSPLESARVCELTLGEAAAARLGRDDQRRTGRRGRCRRARTLRSSASRRALPHPHASTNASTATARQRRPLPDAEDASDRQRRHRRALPPDRGGPRSASARPATAAPTTTCAGKSLFTGRRALSGRRFGPARSPGSRRAPRPR